MLKLNHTADLHFRPSKADDVFASLDALEANSEGVDLTVIAGDLWDYPVQNTGASQFPEYVRRVARIARLAPIVMVQGTPTHDSDGSLDIFEQASERITVLKMGVPYFLHRVGGVTDNIISPESGNNSYALILGIPEPQKKHLIAADSDITLDQAMHTILLGYAAIRQKYADLPCILVYHGQVHGAKMANGETCEGGVSIDDLALVGADYIAMGDIHKPQRVGISRGLHAYYPGAAHPTKDFNEAGIEFGFNQVTIGDEVTIEKTSALGPTEANLFQGIKGMSFSVDIERIPYPHPMLVKIEQKMGEQWKADPPNPSIEGKRVWLEIAARKEDHVDTEFWMKQLLIEGAVQGSKVTIKYLTTETVRAGEITALRRLRDKFVLWMKNSGRTPTDAQLEKCDAIEAAVSGQGLSVAGGAFSFDKMILRGAKGIYKKQRKDEVVLDLIAFDPGILGLIGRNGRGKTTLMNNFHVWSTMPNMGGPLHKQFRLKDSLREVYATDHNTGMRYRSRIKIDPTLKAPKAEYYLDQEIGGEWQSVPGITGRLDDYDEVVNRIFGTLEMYLRTAFMMQFPTSDYPDLSKATKGTKKQIMAVLAGIEFYELYKMNAKARGDNLADAIKDADSRLAAMTENLGDHDELESAMLLAEDRIRKLTDEIPAKKAAGVALSDRVKILEQRAADQRTIEDQVIEVTNRIPRDLASVQECQAQIKELCSMMVKKDPASAHVKEYDDLKAREAEIMAEKTRYLEETAKTTKVYHDAKEKHAQSVRAIENERSDGRLQYQRDRNQLQSALAMNDRDIQRLSEELAKPIADHCPTCRQMLPEDALAHVKEEREKIAEQVKVLGDKSVELSGKIEAMDKTQAEAAQGFADRLAALIAPESPDIAPFAREDELTTVQRAYHLIDIDSARRIIQEAATAGVRIEELEKKIEETRTRIKENQEAVEALKAKIDAELPAQLSAATQGLEDARREYQRLSEELAAAKVTAEHARKDFEEYEANAQAIVDLKAEKERIALELADWRIMEKACGPDGIPALELDAVCPSIAAEANRLLAEQNEGYTIRFETTREGGKGNQIEDFIIWVTDPHGEDQEFETLSGGEAPWVRKALNDSFAKTRSDNAGVRYLTGFMDESESAMDSENRMQYFEMIKEAHEKNNRIHTIVVTHSPELTEILAQKIDVEKLDPEVVT